MSHFGVRRHGISIVGSKGNKGRNGAADVFSGNDAVERRRRRAIMETFMVFKV